MRITDQTVVSVHYALTDGAGTPIDSSEGRDPLVYLHGAGNIIPGLERALDGKSAGDRVETVIEPDDGYGEINPELVENVPRSAFQGAPEVEAGMQFQARDSEGNVRPVVVREVSDETVLVDGNHPLAGVVLHFDVAVESVREATEEELAHGHAH